MKRQKSEQFQKLRNFWKINKEIDKKTTEPPFYQKMYESSEDFPYKKNENSPSKNSNEVKIQHKWNSPTEINPTIPLFNIKPKIFTIKPQISEYTETNTKDISKNKEKIDENIEKSGKKTSKNDATSILQVFEGNLAVNDSKSKKIKNSESKIAKTLEKIDKSIEKFERHPKQVSNFQSYDIHQENEEKIHQKPENFNENIEKNQKYRVKRSEKIRKRNYNTLEIKLLSNWGDSYQIGLFKLELFNENSEKINISPSAINTKHSNSMHSPSILLNSSNFSLNPSENWLSSLHSSKKIRISLKIGAEHTICAIKIWNFSNHGQNLEKGVKDAEVFYNHEKVWKGEIKKREKIEDFTEIVLQVGFKFKDIDSKMIQILNSEVRMVNAPPGSPKKTVKNFRKYKPSLIKLNPSSSQPLILSQNENFLESKFEKREIENLMRNSSPLKIEDLTDKKEKINQKAGPRRYTKTGIDKKTLIQQKSEQCFSNFESFSQHKHETKAENVEFQGEKQEKNEKSNLNKPVSQEKKENSLEKEPILQKTVPRPDKNMKADNSGSGKSDSIPMTKIIPIEEPTIIPELPSGRYLKINLLSTWGDQNFIGLSGIEFWDHEGTPLKIEYPRLQISGNSSSFVSSDFESIIENYAKLINGVYITCDDSQMFMLPFFPKEKNFIQFDFLKLTSLSLIRIWNYNKSRIHSYRGVRYIEIFFDEKNFIFKGNVKKAPGSIKNAEQFCEYIVLTKSSNVLQKIAENDWVDKE